jgi:hypothetical protein
MMLARVPCQARKVVPQHNTVGDGLTMGGLLVLGARGTGPYMVHLESNLGVHADHADVLAAAKRAAEDANSYKAAA